MFPVVVLTVEDDLDRLGDGHGEISVGCPACKFGPEVFPGQGPVYHTVAHGAAPGDLVRGVQQGVAAPPGHLRGRGAYSKRRRKRCYTLACKITKYKIIPKYYFS